jgi:hypothetical protein
MVQLAAANANAITNMRAKSGIHIVWLEWLALLIRQSLHREKRGGASVVGPIVVVEPA